MILQCGNQDCRKWQHLKCIAEAAAKMGGTCCCVIAEMQTYTDVCLADANSMSRKSAKKKKADADDNITIRPNSVAQAKAEKDGVTSEVMIAGSTNEDGQEPPSESFIEVTHPDGDKEVKDVQCLFCKTKIN